MAILPDLDPNEIGVIAFWNCHDHRVAGSDAVIDPTDVLGVLKSYTLYDNGVDGTIEYDPRADFNPRTVNVRVKNDGWIIAWIDRTNEYQLNVSPGDFVAVGYYDLLYSWKDRNANIAEDTNLLLEVINYIYNQLSNKDEFQFIKSDVGIYCYEYSDVNTITFASVVCRGGYEGTRYLKWVITSGTILRYITLTGSSTRGGSGAANVKYRDGTVLAKGVGAGVLNLLDKGVLYDDEDYISNYAKYDGDWAHGCLIAMWR